MSKKSKFTTVGASTRLLLSMEVAINNMIDEIKKPVDSELSGSQRKAELQSIKQTATDAKELLIEYQRLEQMVRELKETGGIEEDKDYSGGFAERFSKQQYLYLLGGLLIQNSAECRCSDVIPQVLLQVQLCGASVTFFEAQEDRMIAERIISSFLIV